MIGRFNSARTAAVTVATLLPHNPDAVTERVSARARDSARNSGAATSRPIDAGVLDVLGMMREQLDTSDPFLVVSGYRSPLTNTQMYLHREGVAKHSYHTKGMAVDLRSEGRSLTEVRDAAMSLQCGGVGYYPRSGFVHVDCGPIRHW